MKAYKHSFFVTTVPTWSTLPAAAVQADTIVAFKAATRRSGVSTAPLHSK